jgi:hypothetical protein
LVDRLGDKRLEHREQPEPANERVGLRRRPAASWGGATNKAFWRVEVAQRDFDAKVDAITLTRRIVRDIARARDSPTTGLVPRRGARARS